jgi:murein DD-endopeptidase MepM/ murein hydrolase activator NlpD
MFAYRVHPTTFIPRYHHTAIDIFKLKGTEVQASYDGKAEVSHDNLAGNWVKIIHPIKTKDGYHLETRYLHLDEVKVKTGNEVHKGEVIGTLGGTGVMDGYFPHLHYEAVMINNEGVGLPIVLDPAQIYFDSPERGFFERIFADPQLDFRSITRDIRGEDVIGQLAQTIKDANPNDRKFLELYKEYWNYEVNEKGSQKANQLLERLR